MTERDIEEARAIVRQIESDPTQAWALPLARAFVRLMEREAHPLIEVPVGLRESGP